MSSVPEKPSRSNNASTSEVLQVKVFLNSRKPVLPIEGRYTFEDLKSVEPIACHWEIRPETSGLSVRGTIAGVLELDCVRCTEGFQLPVTVALDEHYVLDSYVDPYDREHELQAEDFFETISEEGTLDLKDLAHQFLVMESTSQSHCGRPECRFGDA